MIINKRHILPAALTLAALLTSCSQDDFSAGAGGTDIPMQIVPSITGSTKASMQTADLTEFYLQVTSTEAAYSYFDKVSKNGTAWSASKTPLWPDETATVTYSAAYYSGHAFTADEFAQGVDLTVPTDQSTQAGLNSADLLTLKATQTSYEKTDNGTLSVALSHGLAKVNFKLTLGDAFYDAKLGLTDNPVTAFTVKGANTGFNFKPQTGAITVTTGTAADITPLPGTYTPASATSKTATAVYEAILVPQTFTAGALSVSFSVGQGNYMWTNATAITLTAGTTYNLPISATTFPSVTNGHQFVEMGEGYHLKWATCNVGATNPWDYGDYFAWADTVPNYVSLSPLIWREGKTGFNAASYKWIEANQSSEERITKYTFADNQKNGTWWYDGDTFKGDNGDGVEHKDYSSYNYVDDAARYNWGGTWRTPTKEEWTALLNPDNFDWTPTDNYKGSGVKGAIVTSKVEGYVGNSIFLPEAGGYGPLGPIHYEGFYQSSSSGSNSMVSCCMSFKVDMKYNIINNDDELVLYPFPYMFCSHFRVQGSNVRPVSN